MKIVALSGSTVGTTTRTALNYALNVIRQNHPNASIELLDLADYDVQFADGRHYLDYSGDTRYIAEAIMNADAVLIGSPTFQASIPGALKNVFDLLPADGFRNKIVGTVMSAGTSKHFLVAEQQLRPILSYMKAQLVPSHVFIEGKDVYRGELINDDVATRLQRLATDLTRQTLIHDQAVPQWEAAYAC